MSDSHVMPNRTVGATRGDQPAHWQAMEKILVATDGSLSAADAISFAVYCDNAVWKSTPRPASTESTARSSMRSTTRSWSSTSSPTPIRHECSRSDRTPRPNLLEIIWLELADDAQLVIHAMPLRPSFHDLLPGGEGF